MGYPKSANDEEQKRLLRGLCKIPHLMGLVDACNTKTFPPYRMWD